MKSPNNLPDKDSLQMEVFQYRAAPYVAIALHKSIPTHTLISIHLHLNPCNETWETKLKNVVQT